MVGRADTFLIVCTGFVGFFTLLFAMLALMRWLRHRETMAMIERGIVPPYVHRRRNGKGLLVWGIGVMAFGLVFIAGLLLLRPARISSTAPGQPEMIVPAIYIVFPGLVVLFTGAVLLLIYLIARPRQAERSPLETPPWDDFEQMPDSTGSGTPPDEFEAKVQRDA